MTFTIQVKHQGNEWSIDATDNAILEQLYVLPLPLRKACRNGACGICRCLLLEGEVDYGYRLPTALWQHQIDEGYILPCVAKPISSIVIADLPISN